MPLTMCRCGPLFLALPVALGLARTFCTITCLADWAAIRPYSSGAALAMKSPTCGRIAALGVHERDRSIVLTCSTTSNSRDSRISPVLGLISARTCPLP